MIIDDLRQVLTIYGGHLASCQKCAQMPMVPGRTYQSGGERDDFKLWRDKQPCTCGWETALARFEADISKLEKEIQSVKDQCGGEMGCPGYRLGLPSESYTAAIQDYCEKMGAAGYTIETRNVTLHGDEALEAMGLKGTWVEATLKDGK